MRKNILFNCLLISLFTINTVYAEPEADASSGQQQTPQISKNPSMTAVKMNPLSEKYSEIVIASAPYRVAVGECFQLTEDLKNCNAGTNSIPNGIKQAGVIESLTVINGVITITPAVASGFDPSDTYILTPTPAEGGNLLWKSSGGAVAKGLAD